MNEYKYFQPEAVKLSVKFICPHCDKPRTTDIKDVVFLITALIVHCRQCGNVRVDLTGERNA